MSISLKGIFKMTIIWISKKLTIEQQNQKQKETIKQAQSKYQQLNNELIQKQNEVKHTKQVAIALEKQMKQAESNAAIENSYTNETNTANQLLNQVEQYRVEIEKLQQEININESNLTQKQQSHYNVNSKLDQLKQDKEPIQNEVSQKGEEIKNLKAELDTKQNKVYSLQNHLQMSSLASEQHINLPPETPVQPQNEDKIETSSAYDQATILENKQYLAELQALNVEIERLNQTIPELQAYIDTQWQKVQEIDEKISQYENQKNNLEQDIQKLSVQLDKQRSLLVQHNQNAEKALSEAENLHSSIEQKRQKNQFAKTTKDEQNAKYILPTGEWVSQYEAVVGLSHRKNKEALPCQDAATAFSLPKLHRAAIITADGAGSSAVSDLGSAAVVNGLSRFLQTLNPLLSPLLDEDNFDEEYDRFAKIVVNHARGILLDLAAQHRRPMKDFRCTLLMAVVGIKHTLWIKVGDGALVAEKRFYENKELRAERATLGNVGKGEYANQTVFIDENLRPSDIQSGVISSEQLTALFAMSDGAAERFVANDGSRVAKKLSDWADELRQDRLGRHKITAYFYSDEFQKGKNGHHSGDDCSIAMIAR